MIPNQDDPKFSVPREFFETLKKNAWNAVTFTRREGDQIIRGGTFLGEGYAYSWVEAPPPAYFRRVNNSDRIKGAILFDESLHNYFAMDHDKLVQVLGADTKGRKADIGLQYWIRGGCK